MMEADERQHLRAVFACRHMPYRLALHANGCGFRAEETVGVDLHLDAAIAENTLGDDRDHIDAVDLGRHDEGCRLVIWISGAGADRGDEHILFVDDLAVPIAAGLERHQPSAMRYRSLQQDMRINAHELAVVIGVAVAGASRPRLDVAHHRAGIAADLVGRRVSRHARSQFHSYTNDVARPAKDCQARSSGRLARLYANGILEKCPNHMREPEATRMTPPAIHLNVNGRIHEVSAAPDTALLYVLRNDLELNGPKYGCGLGECGTCTVLIDGVAARACVIPISGCVGREILTLEGLGSREQPDPVQQAFIDEQAAQCATASMA